MADTGSAFLPSMWAGLRGKLVARNSTMIPSAIDPSLHTAQPGPPWLDDGFSFPRAVSESTQPAEAGLPPSLGEALAAKSQF
jgi:hypothetical protein